MFYLNKCLRKINTHWPKTAWVTQIYQTFQPTGEELKPSEKWNTLLPRHQTGAILIYQRAYFTLKIIDTNSTHSALLCQCSSTRAECEAQTQLSVPCLSRSCQPKHKAGLNYCSNHNWTPAALTKLCQTQACSKPKLLWVLGIRKDFHILRTGKQWSSLPKTRHFWGESQASGLQQILLGAGDWTRSSSKVPSKWNYAVNHSWALPSHTQAGTGLTLLSWVTWHFHSWDISFLKHLTPH